MAVVVPHSLSNHPSLVGIIRFPLCTYQTTSVVVPQIVKGSGVESNRFVSVRQEVQMAENIISQPVQSETITIPKSDITDYYPYTFYLLADGEAETVVYKPQYMPNQSYIVGNYALSHNPIERYFLYGYKGDTEGHMYNLTNTNQMMLPTASNEGMNYLQANANSIAQARSNQVNANIRGGVLGVVGQLANFSIGGTLGEIDNILGGLEKVKSMDAQQTDIQMTPDSIKSFGTPSTRKAFGTDKVVLYRMSIKEESKEKVRDFNHRYGNKYHRYNTIDHTHYKGYVKTGNVKLTGGFDHSYMNQLISIFERGVYIE